MGEWKGEVTLATQREIPREWRGFGQALKRLGKEAGAPKGYGHSHKAPPAEQTGWLYLQNQSPRGERFLLEARGF